MDHPRRADCPPSTGSSTPVTKRASSDARNSAALATSHAVPIVRPRGTMASRWATNSARSMPRAAEIPSIAIGVFISPGRIALTRIPCRATRIARCSVREFTPALEIWYAAVFVEQIDAIEDPLPGVLLDARRRLVPAADADVVVQDVERAERCQRDIRDGGAGLAIG